MITFATILFLSVLLRIIGINWDQGFYFHPDELALHYVSQRIDFFSNLNPNFFNYGTLPIYLLKGIAQILQFEYDPYKVMILGRVLSTLSDMGTLVVIFLICRLLFQKKSIAYAASFFYAIAFFPIQNAHFFIVDTFLSFFLTLTIYQLLRYWKNPSLKSIIYIAIALAAALSSKFTSIIFVPFICIALLIVSKHKIRDILTFSFSLLVFHFLFMPYVFLDYKSFIKDIALQLKLNSDPYFFPYTLQYVGTTPYFYYLKNIFLWGLGPVLSIMSLYGIFLVIKNFKFQNPNFKQNLNVKILIFTIFYFYYFLVLGRSAVKFMRYMLPLYPFFVITAAYGFNKLKRSLKFVVIIIAVLWSALFFSLYARPNTRISATNWIHTNIPQGSIIAVEHWDLRLPVTNSERYQIVELPLYNLPDDKEKWKNIQEPLKTVDYVVIASNRLYTPLQKLTDCKKYKICYPLTAKYYQKLFSKKPIAEFTNYPKLEIGNWKLEINDSSADESFTVYDHPTIYIFKL